MQRVWWSWSGLSFGSGLFLRPTEPFVETDAAQPHFAQRHERAIVDQAAEVSGLGVTHDLTRVAARFQVAGNNVAERRSIGASDLDDAVTRRREGRIGDVGRHVVRRDGLEQAGRNPDAASNRA